MHSLWGAFPYGEMPAASLGAAHSAFPQCCHLSEGWDPLAGWQPLEHEATTFWAVVGWVCWCPGTSCTPVPSSAAACAVRQSRGLQGTRTYRWRDVVGQLLWVVFVEVLSPKSTKSRSTAHLADGTARFHW